MTRANWLIESDTFGEGLGRIRDEIRKQGMRVEIVSYIPAQSGMTYKDLYGPDECVVFYGSLEFAEQVRRQTTWVPGVYHTRDNFRCVSYYPQLAKYLLNSDYIMIPYGELMRQQSFLFSCLGEDDAVFIRPDVGYKIFTGQLIYRERFERDVQRLGFYEVKPSELCVVSRPRNLINEWRFVIADRKAIAGSRYRHNTAYDEDPGYPPEAESLANKIASDPDFTPPDRVWCLDICQTKPGNYYLLEIGCFSCAGLYMCDFEPIVREVSRIAAEDHRTYNEV